MQGVNLDNYWRPNMVTDEENTIKKNKDLYKNNINIFQHFVFVTMILSLFFLFNHNFYLFHSAAELFSCIIAGGVFMVSLATYKITRNKYFMFLGTGYFFILTLDLFHTINFGDILVSSYFVYDVDTRFWVAARGLELLTILISFLFLFKRNIKCNCYFVFLCYYVISFFLVLDIVHLNVLIPVMRLEETGITEFKINFEYAVATGFVICSCILFLLKDKLDKNLFIFLEISLTFKIFSELFFTMYYNVTDFYNMMGHIFKVVSYYFLYMGVIANGLQRPFDMINNNLDNADCKVIEKEKQRRYMEEVIYQNEQCYDWLIDNSSNGIIIVRNKKILYSNTTAMKLFGAKSMEEITDQDITELVMDNLICDEKYKELVNTNRFNELKLLNLNKETLDVEFSLNRITYRGTPAYLIILKDMKLKHEINNLKVNLKENEIELTKSNEFNKELTEFFSNISHELKTPINIILSAVQLINVKKEYNNLEEFMVHLNRLLGIIKQNCFRLTRLISNLIDISKFESGFSKLELKNRNIVNIVEDITLSVGDYVKSKGTNIIFDTDVEERIIAVDSDKIERILLNLLSNAVKFTDMDDEILVNFTDGEDFVKISVKDTGIGMPEEKLKVIFDRFAQVENTLIRNREGSGIGLSLVKTLIDMHEGRIDVKSKIGEGSEFIIELPVRLFENDKEIDSLNIKTDNKIDKILLEFSDIYSID
jgi:signal transduction histidine kinase